MPKVAALFRWIRANIPEPVKEARREQMLVHLLAEKKSAEAGGSKAEDLYQLRMYHDGCIADDMEVQEAVLIAQRYPDTVRALLAELNRQKDKKGCPYHFALSTWDEEGIVLPPDAA